jgi:hypothetical protein
MPLDKPLRLSTLARTRRPQQDDIHARNPLFTARWPPVSSGPSSAHAAFQLGLLDQIAILVRQQM